MTTPKAADAATSEDVLPTRGLRLLGTMGSSAAPEALLLLGAMFSKFLLAIEQAAQRF